MTNTESVDDLSATLRKLEKTFGMTSILEELNQLEQSRYESVLTVVSNLGLHPLPAYLMRGRVIYASIGNLNFLSAETANADFLRILRQLKIQLVTLRPTTIYLIPWGPAALSCQIKNLVFKTLGIDTIDVLFLGEGRYVDLSINLREDLMPSPHTND